MNASDKYVAIEILFPSNKIRLIHNDSDYQKRNYGNWVLFPFVKIKLRLNPKLTAKHKSAIIKLFEEEDSDRKILQNFIAYYTWSGVILW